MVDTDQCELHDAVILVGAEESEDFVRLARSPIGDECQRCTICRFAREYVERRLAEEAGGRLPPGESAGAAWEKLQGAIAAVKDSVRRAA